MVFGVGEIMAVGSTENGRLLADLEADAGVDSEMESVPKARGRSAIARLTVEVATRRGVVAMALESGCLSEEIDSTLDSVTKVVFQASEGTVVVCTTVEDIVT